VRFLGIFPEFLINSQIVGITTIKLKTFVGKSKLNYFKSELKQNIIEAWYVLVMTSDVEE